MKNKENKALFKKSIASLAVASIISFGAISYPSKADAAAFLSIDIPNLLQNTSASIMRGIEAVKEHELLMRIIQNAGDLTAMIVDNENNGFANIITRQGKATQDVQNIEQAERARPAQDACDTMIASYQLEEALCRGLDQMAGISSKQIDANLIAAGMGKPIVGKDGKVTIDTTKPPGVDDINRVNNANASRVVDRCEKLLDKNGKSLCANPSLMISPPGNVLDEKEYEAVQLQMDIVAGVEIQTPEANEMLGSKDSVPYKKAVNRDLQRTLPISQARANMEIVNILLNGTSTGEGENAERKKGDVEVLEEYLNSRLGSRNWLCEATNTCPEEGGLFDEVNNYVPPDELERRSIQMDTVMLHLGFQQYKSSLRAEKLLADLVLLEANARN